MKFSPHILCAIILVAGSPKLSARLGNSLDECKQRYGDPTSGPEDHHVVSQDGSRFVPKKYGFSAAGLDIEVLILSYVDANSPYEDVIKINYSKADGSAFNVWEVETLLSKNANAVWVSSKSKDLEVTNWQTGDGSRFAKLEKGAGLTVWSEKWNQISSAASKQPTEKEKAEKDVEDL